MPVEKIIIGRDRPDLEKFGSTGTAFIGKHIVGTGEEAHLTNPIQLDLIRPHVVLVAGKRGTGKCMIGSTPVTLSDGSVLPIKSIVEAAKGKKIIHNSNEMLVKVNKPIEILALNRDLKIKPSKASHVYKKKISENIIRIKTRSGRELTVTKEHPLLTFSGKLEWNAASKLTKDCYIALPRELTSTTSFNFRFEDFGEPATKLKSRVKTEILTELLEGKKPLSSLAKEVGSEHVWEFAHKLASEGLVRVRNNSPLTAELTDRGWELAQSLCYDYRRLSEYAVPVKIPKTFDKDFAAWLAYIIAEGCEQSHKSHSRFIFSNADPEKLDDFVLLSESLFGIKPRKMSHGLYIDSQALLNILDQIGYTAHKKSKNKDVPLAILKSKNDIVKSFLRVYFDCEAYVSKREPAIELSSASKEIINKLSNMLLRFGIFPLIKKKLKYAANTKKKTRRSYYNLTISGVENLALFAQNIGFGDNAKNTRLKKHLALESNPNLDVIPNVGRLISEIKTALGLRDCDLHRTKQVAKAYRDGKYNPTRKFLKKILSVFRSNFEKKSNIHAVKDKICLLEQLTNSDIFWDRIVEIKEEFFNGKVYDLTVPEEHNFVAGFGGVICHNSYSAGVISEEMALLPEEIRQNLSALLVDTMGIYWSMRNPNEKGRNLLRQWKIKPQGFPTQLFVPKKFVKEYEEVGVKPTPFTLPCGELTATDWIMTFGFSPIDPYGIALERAVKTTQDRHGTSFEIADIIKSVEADKRTEQKIKDALVNRLLAAQDWGLFEKIGTPIKDIFKAGTISVLDVSHYMRVSGVWSIRGMLVGLLCRKIFQERLMARKAEEFESITGTRRKKVPMAWILIDEAHQFVGTGEPTAATEPLLTLIKEGREPGISVLMITQRPGKLHEDALAQCDLILSHRLTARADIEALRAIMQTYVLEDIQELINSLPRMKGSAIVLDDNSERLYTLQVRPRLSWHAGGSPAAAREKGLFE